MWQNVSKGIATSFYLCAQIRREQTIQWEVAAYEAIHQNLSCHGIPFSEYCYLFCVFILRSPYGLVRDANEMLMTWSAKRLENVLKTPRYSNEFMRYNYYGNTSLYQQAICAILSSVGIFCCFLYSRYFVLFSKQRVYDY